MSLADNFSITNLLFNHRLYKLQRKDKDSFIVTYGRKCSLISEEDVYKNIKEGYWEITNK